MKLSKMLRLYRASVGMRQKDMAEEIGIKPSTLTRLDYHKPEGDTLVKLLVWMLK